MIRALKAGARYFGLVFAAGALLGTLRVLTLEPVVGAPGAVLAELPVMLAVAWIACGLVVRRSSVSTRFGDRGVMGVTAFALLLLAELTLSLLLGRTLVEHLSLHRQLDAQLGLMGQLAFAGFPMIRLRGASRAPER